jgi:Tfp pilus assembly protein PilE
VRARRRIDSESGETLLELVVAIAILGVCVVAIGSAIVLSIKMSAIHRAQATADDFLHNYAESLHYSACSGGTPPNYVALASLPTPNGFATPQATVKFWNGTAFASSTCPGTDPGLQQVTLTLNSTDGFVSESLVTIVRNAT